MAVAQQGSLGTATIRVIANTTEFDYRLRRSLRGLSVSAAAAGAALVGINFLGGSLKEAAKLETVMARIKTIMQAGDESFINPDALRRASDAFGIAATEIGEAAYLALSSGTAAKDVMDVVAASAKNALTTNSSIVEAVNATTSALNAFGKTGLTAEKANDILFKSLQFGKGSMREFSRYISNAIPIVSQLTNGSKDAFAELSALGAVSTLTGKTARVAFTGIKVAMQELTDSSKGAGEVFADVMGKSFQQAMKDGDSLSKTLVDFGKKVGGENLTNIFGAKEGAAAIQQILSIPEDRLKEIVKSVKNSKGVTATEFKKIEKTYAYQLNRLREMWKNTKSEFGENIVPAATAVIKQGQKFITSIRPTFSKIGKAVGGFLTENGGAIKSFVVDNLKALGTELVRVGGIVYTAVAPSFKRLFDELGKFDWASLMEIVKSLAEGALPVFVAALIGLVEATKILLQVLSPIVSVLGDANELLIIGAALWAAYRVQMALTAATMAVAGGNARKAGTGLAILNGVLFGAGGKGSGSRRAGSPSAGLSGIPLLLARIPGPAKVAAVALLGLSYAASFAADTGNAKLSSMDKTMIIMKGSASALAVPFTESLGLISSAFGMAENPVSHFFHNLSDKAIQGTKDADARLRGFANTMEETAYRAAVVANQIGLSVTQAAINASLLQKIEHPDEFAKTGGFVALQGPIAGGTEDPRPNDLIAPKNVIDAAMESWRAEQKVKEDMAALDKKWKQDMADAAKEAAASTAKLDSDAAKDAAKEQAKFEKAAFKSSRTLFAKMLKNPAKLTFDQVGQMFKDLGTKLKDAGRKDLVKALDPYRKALLKTAKEHDKVIEKLDVAKDKLKSLKDEAKDYAKSIKESVADLGNITQNNSYHELLGADTNKMLLNLNNAVASSKQFLVVFKQLKSMGLNNTMLQQIMDAGVIDGLNAGQALVNAGQATIDLFNAGQADLTKNGKDIGSLAVSTFKQHGIDMAQGLVNELTAQDAMLSKAMETLGQKMAKAFKNGLGSAGLILDPTKQLSPAAAKLASKSGDPQTVVGKTDKNGDTHVSVFIDGQEFKGMIHTEIKTTDRNKKAAAKSGSRTGTAGARA